MYNILNSQKKYLFILYNGEYFSDNMYLNHKNTKKLVLLNSNIDNTFVFNKIYSKKRFLSKRIPPIRDAHRQAFYYINPF